MLQIKHEHHDWFEIIQTWTDEGHVLINDSIYPMKSGNVYFINAIGIHSTNPDNVIKYERNKIFVSGSYIMSVAKQFGFDDIMSEVFIDKGGMSCALEIETALVIDKMFKEMARVYNSDENYKSSKITAELIKLIIYAYENKKDYKQISNTIIEKAIKYINDNISSKMLINEIADSVHVSKFYLCHLFKNTINMTISDYILHRRISIAENQLIKDIKAPISEIAIRSGFSSFSYFNQVFKKVEKITPSEFRRKHIGEF